MNSTAGFKRHNLPATPEHAAQTFFLRHGWGDDVNASVSNCIAMLSSDYGMAMATAEVIALQACAELRCRNTGARIETDITTDSVVFVKDRSGNRHVIFVDALLRKHDEILAACSTVH